MAKLILEIPTVASRRLEALSLASGKSIEELAIEAIDSFAGSISSRRAIRKARRSSANETGQGYTLTDLGWLEGYSGESVDEILSLDGTENPGPLLIALAEAVREKKGSRTGIERVLLAVMTFCQEVNNGGFHQYFFNSSRQTSPAIVDDLVRIGCPEIADIAQRALDALKLARITPEAVEAAIRIPNRERDRILSRCDIAFYERGELLGRLLSFAKAHQEGIGRIL